METPRTNFNLADNDKLRDRPRRRSRNCRWRVQQSRLISRQGNTQLHHMNVPKCHFFVDYFTTLMEWPWKFFLAFFSLAFLTSWLLFGSIWWGIYIHRLKYFNVACIKNIDGWTSMFLFSLETQTTIGYGGRQITPDCPEGIFLLLIECIVSLLIVLTMVGLVSARLRRPHLRSSTILFSNTAVIAPRDGKMCLMFRVADIRKSHLLNPCVRVFLIQHQTFSTTEEGTVYQRNLRTTFDRNNTTQSCGFYLFVPLAACHIIDKDSPLYHYSQEKLQEEVCEIVVILEAIIEPTGKVVQTRTSYMPEQIKWGHVFSKMVDEDNTIRNENYTINFSKFHSTEPVNPRQKIEYESAV